MEPEKKFPQPNRQIEEAVNRTLGWIVLILLVVGTSLFFFLKFIN